MENTGQQGIAGRLDGLDVLRALAVMLTLCRHMLKRNTSYPPPISTFVEVSHTSAGRGWISSSS